MSRETLDTEGAATDEERVRARARARARAEVRARAEDERRRRVADEEESAAHGRSDASRDDAAEGETTDPLDAGRRLLDELGELKEHVRYALGVRAEVFKGKVREVVVCAAAGVLGLVLVAALVAAAGVQVASGLAGAYALLFPDAPWAGALLSGATILGLFGALVVMAKMRSQRKTKKALGERFRLWRKRTEDGPEGEGEE